MLSSFYEGPRQRAISLLLPPSGRSRGTRLFHQCAHRADRYFVGFCGFEGISMIQAKQMWELTRSETQGKDRFETEPICQHYSIPSKELQIHWPSYYVANFQAVALFDLIIEGLHSCSHFYLFRLALSSAQRPKAQDTGYAHREIGSAYRSWEGGFILCPSHANRGKPQASRFLTGYFLEVGLSLSYHPPGNQCSGTIGTNLSVFHPECHLIRIAVKPLQHLLSRPLRPQHILH